MQTIRSIDRRINNGAVLAIVVLVVAALTALLYWDSISYGFMFDDPLDLSRASGRSYVDLFTSAGESSYYRPLILVIWKTLHDVFGGVNNGPFLHFLVLCSHVVNGVLVYWIGSRLFGRIGGCVSAILFVTFPLSYQAVAKVNAFFHPLVTTFLLLSFMAYWRWRDARVTDASVGSENTRSGRVWLVLSVLAAVLAVLTHEYGVIVAGLILTAEFYWLINQGHRRPSVAVALFILISLGYLAIWWMVPRWQHQWRVDLGSIQFNCMYFFQGVIYPVAGNLATWSSPLGLSDAKVLALFGVPIVVVIATAHVLSRRLAAIALSVFWIGLAVLPAIVGLPAGYVVDGPRLFYLASVGIALIWGGMLTTPFQHTKNAVRVGGGVVAVVVAVAIVFQSATFVLEREPLFVEGAKVVRSLATTATDPQRPGRIYVNFPSWFALRSQDYLLGHTGVTMVPTYIGLGRVIYIQKGIQPEITSISYDVIAEQWDHNYGRHGSPAGLDQLEIAFRKGGGVYATRFYPGTIDLEYVGGILQQQASDPGNGFLASFGEWARLTSAQVRVDKGAVDLTMQWFAYGASQGDYTAFVHVYNARNEIVAQADGYPIGEMFPPQKWRAGDVIDDHRRVALPADIEPGSYRVVLGFYDRQTGQRATATGPNGVRYKDDAVEIDEVAVSSAAQP